MAYDHAQRNDADYYDDQADQFYCEECGMAYDYCQCLAHGPETESQPPTTEELWAAYKESGDTKDLPF